ncbi:MAG TPA: M1 family aminopeptidase [Gemmatimonadaceae bacterium]|nr:M1 family aminopeptidase [Gemmatimonadaceae bacterium]
MTLRLAALALASIGAFACAPKPQPAPTPAPVPATPAVTTVTPQAPAPVVVDTMRSYAVPAFRSSPMITWGPLPPGTPHAERTRTYDLQHQIVRVRFDWSRHAVVGSTTLRIAALGEPVTTVPLDAVGMTIQKVSAPNGARLRYEYDGKTLTVRLPGTLRPRSSTSFVVDYESVRPKKGAYFIDRRHVVWTQGETEDNRYWVPTYDYPNDKTTWEFYIRTDSNEKALSNGALRGQRRVGDQIEWHWVLDQPNSTYLMTAVTGDYLVLQDKWRDVPVGYWTYPDSADATWRGMGKTPRMIDLFSRQTGVRYPFAKYDQVNAPDYIFGGMENVTATTQADDDILHPAWAEPQANAEGLVSHELGHQWYGDYLTTKDWSHIWLNEGFATFMEQTWTELGMSKDDGDVDRLNAHRQTIEADRNARRPIVYDRWVTDPLELFFSGHIYPKGASILQMLRHQLGDSAFWHAMNRYTTRHAKGNVVSDDLRRAFEETTGRDYKQFFDRWVYGAGFPVFQVSYGWDAATRSVTIDAREVQERDSLTGYFDPDVDIEILTDSGPVRGVVQVRNGAGHGSFPVRGEPRSIRWDKGNWLLDLTDFPRPTTMLAWQLAHDDDVVGRLEAVELLGERSDELVAQRALVAATRDASQYVRSAAVGALATQGSIPDVASTIVAVTRDADPRVRQAAARALASVGAAAGSARARELAASDSSLWVRGTALVTLSRLEGANSLDAIRAALDQNSWLDVTRQSAVRALRGVDSPEALPMLTRFLAAGTSRNTRVAAISAMVARAAGHEAEVAAAVTPLLDAEDDLFVRIEAARALGELKQQSSIAALEARRRVEAESRVINTIDAALEKLRGK